MSQTTPIQCPQCSEENPAEAVICWACGSPLDGEVVPLEQRETSEFLEDELGYSHPVPPQTRRQKSLQAFRDLAPIVLYGAVISSGWWRGKTRFATLGTGLLGLYLFDQWKDRVDSEFNRQFSEAPPRQDDTGRIADTILREAVGAGATQIRILGAGVEMHDIKFQVKGEWRLHLHFSWRGLHALQQEFLQRARPNSLRITSFGVMLNLQKIEGIEFRRKVPLSPDEQNARFALQIWNEPARAEILLTRLETQTEA